MGSGSLRLQGDKTAFQSFQLAADHSLINLSADDVTSRAPAATKGHVCLCVCVYEGGAQVELKAGNTTSEEWECTQLF